MLTEREREREADRMGFMKQVKIKPKMNQAFIGLNHFCVSLK